MDGSQAITKTEPEPASLGPLFSALPSRVLRRYLWRYLDVPELLTLTETCWTLFVQCNEEGIWRDVCLHSPFIDAEKKLSLFTFNGSWKHTVCAFYYGSLRLQHSHGCKEEEASSFGDLSSKTSQTKLEECRTVGEALVRFNVLLPRIVTCLFRDGVMSRPDYESWMLKTQFQIDAESSERVLPALSPDWTSLPASVPDLTRWWQENVVGKPYVPALAPLYLQLSTGAVKYFLCDGSFLRPPAYARKRDPQRRQTREGTEFTNHNWAGACLLDLVPLPAWCPVETFVATMEWKGVPAATEAVKRGRTAQPPSTFFGGAAARSPLPDEYRGVPGMVDRRHRLSVEAFRDEYETPNTPVVLTGCLDEWPARTEWQDLRFFQKFSNEPLKANGRTTSGRRFRMRAADYVAYGASINGEKPMYIFDKKVLHRCPALCHDYAVPPHFREDFFAFMAEEDRPDYRWLLVGPDGSGTPFHTDPHGTSAWNAVLAGCKRVTFYPPHVIPPGVEEKWIHSDYYASEPFLRWYRTRGRDLPRGAAVRGTMSSDPHFADATRACDGEEGGEALLPVEALVFPGDIIFIPSGWWHQVLNIGCTTAVTQNFCSSVTLPRVVADMNAYADRQVLKDFQVALRRAGRDDLAVQLRVGPANP